MSDLKGIKINNSSASLRKIKKPLIEKRRRDRMNKSLSQLKTLLLDYMKRSGVTQTSKLDKADILELTVSYVKLIQFEELEASMETRRQYKSGYLSCASSALNFMDESLSVNQTLKNNLKTFLVDRCERASAMDIDRARNIESSIQPIRDPLTVKIPSYPFSNERNQERTKFSNRIPREVEKQVLATFDKRQCQVLRKSSTDSYVCSKTIQNRPSQIDVIQEDASHSLNLSACDSSFNGDVWRPW